METVLSGDIWRFLFTSTSEVHVIRVSVLCIDMPTFMSSLKDIVNFSYNIKLDGVALLITDYGVKAATKM